MSIHNNSIYNTDINDLMRKNSRHELQERVDTLKNDLCNLKTGMANDISKLFVSSMRQQYERSSSIRTDYDKLVERREVDSVIATVKIIINNALSSITSQYADVAMQLDTLLGGYEGTIAELQAALATKVDKTTKVNGYTLDSDVDLQPSDVYLNPIQNNEIDNLEGE